MKGVEIQPPDQQCPDVHLYLSFICLYPASFQERSGITCNTNRTDEEDKQKEKVTVGTKQRD